LIALLLMLGGIRSVIENVLMVYSNFAVAWFGAIIADLMINKPLRLSPPGIEFRRAYLNDVNPVGVGAMVISIFCSSLCFSGIFGIGLQMFSPVVGLVTAFAAAPAIAWGTKGRFYLARPLDELGAEPCKCKVCENTYEAPDMAICPVYDGNICSLCCTLEARCHDACKKQPQNVESVVSVVRRFIPAPLTNVVYARVIRFLAAYIVSLGVLGAILLLIYYQRLASGVEAAGLHGVLLSVFVAFTVIAAFGVWYFVLARESQRAAEQESERQTLSLLEEIDAHARTDAELQRAKNAADAANLAKSRYIVGMSHEIRTPLNTISGYAQLMERGDGTPVRDAVRVIKRSAAHLADLVEGLVDVSRIENGTVTIARERVNLTDLLAQVVDMFRVQAASRGIRFDFSASPHLPDWINADEKRLRQILINLISNAIKYTPAGSVALNVVWRNPVVVFEVQDTGIGIESGNLDRIFEPFERVESGQKQPGVGLGLTITRLLVDIMGGQLTVESVPGLGSTFRVKMFLSEVNMSPGEPVGPGTRRLHLLPRRRILVVDDNPAHLQLTRDLLAPTGLDLMTADSGLAALDLCRKAMPDLIMMDVNMPHMDGWDTARLIREEHGEEIAILMVSANVHDFQRARKPDDPHDDHLTKPYDIDALIERILMLLELDSPAPQGTGT
jgi:signal transduction histidine kinase/CheY-like chemotaxis protein